MMAVFPLLLLFLLPIFTNASPINRQVGLTENVFMTTQNGTDGMEHRVCSIDSVTYMDGETIPTSSPCEQCVCRPPGFACTITSCEYRAGCKAFRRSDQCCPEYQCECEKDGKIYQNGDKILDSNNPCEVCYCQGGEIVCAVIDCYWRNDCAPRYIDNRCCPMYDHCPSPAAQGPIRHRLPVLSTPVPISWLNLTQPPVPVTSPAQIATSEVTTTSTTTTTTSVPTTTSPTTVTTTTTTEASTTTSSTTAPTTTVPVSTTTTETQIIEKTAESQATEQQNDKAGATDENVPVESTTTQPEIEASGDPVSVNDQEATTVHVLNDDVHSENLVNESVQPTQPLQVNDVMETIYKVVSQSSDSASTIIGSPTATPLQNIVKTTQLVNEVSQDETASTHVPSNDEVYPVVPTTPTPFVEEIIVENDDKSEDDFVTTQQPVVTEKGAGHLVVHEIEELSDAQVSTEPSIVQDEASIVTTSVPFKTVEEVPEAIVRHDLFEANGQALNEDPVVTTVIPEAPAVVPFQNDLLRIFPALQRESESQRISETTLASVAADATAAYVEQDGLAIPSANELGHYQIQENVGFDNLDASGATEENNENSTASPKERISTAEVVNDDALTHSDNASVEVTTENSHDETGKVKVNEVAESEPLQDLRSETERINPEQSKGEYISVDIADPSTEGTVSSPNKPENFDIILDDEVTPDHPETLNQVHEDRPHVESIDSQSHTVVETTAASLAPFDETLSDPVTTPPTYNQAVVFDAELKQEAIPSSYDSSVHAINVEFTTPRLFRDDIDEMLRHHGESHKEDVQTTTATEGVFLDDVQLTTNAPMLDDDPVATTSKTFTSEQAYKNKVQKVSEMLTQENIIPVSQEEELTSGSKFRLDSSVFSGSSLENGDSVEATTAHVAHDMGQELFTEVTTAREFELTADEVVRDDVIADASTAATEVLHDAGAVEVTTTKTTDEALSNLKSDSLEDEKEVTATTYASIHNINNDEVEASVDGSGATQEPAHEDPMFDDMHAAEGSGDSPGLARFDLDMADIDPVVTADQVSSQTTKPVEIVSDESATSSTFQDIVSDEITTQVPIFIDVAANDEVYTQGPELVTHPYLKEYVNDEQDLVATNDERTTSVPQRRSDVDFTTQFPDNVLKDDETVTQAAEVNVVVHNYNRLPVTVIHAITNDKVSVPANLVPKIVHDDEVTSKPSYSFRLDLGSIEDDNVVETHDSLEVTSQVPFNDEVPTTKRNALQSDEVNIVIPQVQEDVFEDEAQATTLSSIPSRFRTGLDDEVDEDTLSQDIAETQTTSSASHTKSSQFAEGLEKHPADVVHDIIPVSDDTATHAPIPTLNLIREDSSSNVVQSHETEQQVINEVEILNEPTARAPAIHDEAIATDVSATESIVNDEPVSDATQVPAGALHSEQVTSRSTDILSDDAPTVTQSPIEIFGDDTGITENVQEMSSDVAEPTEPNNLTSSHKERIDTDAGFHDAFHNEVTTHSAKDLLNDATTAPLFDFGDNTSSKPAESAHAQDDTVVFSEEPLPTVQPLDRLRSDFTSSNEQELVNDATAKVVNDDLGTPSPFQDDVTSSVINDDPTPSQLQHDVTPSIVNDYPTVTVVNDEAATTAIPSREVLGDDPIETSTTNSTTIPSIFAAVKVIKKQETVLPENGLPKIQPISPDLADKHELHQMHHDFPMNPDKESSWLTRAANQLRKLAGFTNTADNQPNPQSSRVRLPNRRFLLF